MSLAKTLAGIAQDLHSFESWEETLQGIVEAARLTIDGADGAGIMLLRRKGAVESPAYTGDPVLACDRVQAELGEGPCVEALWDAPVVRIDDMAREERWPNFARCAVELGVQSMLACRLSTQAEVLGSLNLHSRRPKAFDEDADQMTEVFAAHASIALADAHLSTTLRSAVTSRQVIGEATGILMERYGISSRQAFGMLVTASQHMNVKLRIVAEDVVRTRRDPGGAVPGR
ncbi:GAF and ANTAR domain-containing protein [Wenjunlia tyrosinilytica]|uniref:ANTAR domain-containing protein n=1 Tax=Wenjunlia tyrosinilytica TaxID=1544741 RepID=A0A917ZS46_9ACTN|nr:GAF and ANTAR domain-containing protein [Wenjunlia tyrosinilytica]GGO90928.1 hypothetical protein GCM10012280_37590 [Wenjunlia tyrosinilytica]